jgi:hypothetical protein
MFSPGKKQPDLGALFQNLQAGGLKDFDMSGGMGLLRLIMGGMMGDRQPPAADPASPAAAPGTEAPAAAPGTEAPAAAAPASLRSTPQWWQTWRAKNGGAPPVRGLLG